MGIRAGYTECIDPAAMDPAAVRTLRRKSYSSLMGPDRCSRKGVVHFFLGSGPPVAFAQYRPAFLRERAQKISGPHWGGVAGNRANEGLARQHLGGNHTPA